MQVCSQCAHTLLPEPNRPSGERRHCPHCKADLPTEEVPSELFDLPVPLRQLPTPLTSQAEEDALPVPLRPALDYRKERPKSSPPHPPPLHVVVPSERPDSRPPRHLPPPGVLPTLSIGPTSNPPPSAAQITMPEQLGPGKATTGSRPLSDPADPADPARHEPGEGVRADRSTTNAKPLVLPLETTVSDSSPGDESTTADRPASNPSPPVQAQPSPPPTDPVQLGRLAARAGSTQSAKPISLTAKSPAPLSQNSASSQPGDMPLSAMFSMAASRQSLTSQTPQALKLGWLIAGLALAALLLLLTILVLVERSRDTGPPLLPPAGSMQ